MEGLPRRSQSLREAKLQRLGRLQETFSQIATVCNYNNNILHCVSIHQPMSTELLCMNNDILYVMKSSELRGLWAGFWTLHFRVINRVLELISTARR